MMTDDNQMDAIRQTLTDTMATVQRVEKRMKEVFQWWEGMEQRGQLLPMSTSERLGFERLQEQCERFMVEGERILNSTMATRLCSAGQVRRRSAIPWQGEPGEYTCVDCGDKVEERVAVQILAEENATPAPERACHSCGWLYQMFQDEYFPNGAWVRLA
jgi:hypothetical protein